MNRFKVGDKVQVKDLESVIDFYSLPKIDNSEFIVVGIRDDELLIKPNCSTKTNCYFIDKADAFELVAPADKKREFLERLQSLLREFDATIDIGLNVDDKRGRCGVLIEMNNDRIFFPVVFTEMSDDPAVIAQRKFTNYPITADNIMDFDKE